MSPPEDPGDGWSTPSIFGTRADERAGPVLEDPAQPPEGRDHGLDIVVSRPHQPDFSMVAPRMFTEADPVPAFLFDDSGDGDNPWSSTNYFGPRRHRPSTTPAAATIAGLTSGGVSGGVGVASGGDPGSDGLVADDPKPDPDAAPREDRGLMASSRTMAIASLVSRLTGFLRNVVIVAALGSAGVADAYNSGNSFPNMVYELLLGGVLSSVLIPLLVHAQVSDSDRGQAYTQRLLSIATAALGLATLFAVAMAPYIAAAFVDAGPQRQLTSLFATLLLPEIFFYGLGALFTAVLNTRHVYGPGAWAPVLNNVITLLTVAVFLIMPGPHTLNPSTITTAQILVIGVGTTLGIVGQALVLVPALRRSGFVWDWRFRATPNEAGRLREAGSLSGWIIGYVVASQVGVTVILKVANDHHGVTIFTNSDLLFQMPYGILVVSLLTALMPRMSRAAARQDDAAVVDDLSLGARLSAVALVPITAGLIALGPAFTTVFFDYGNNTLADARQYGINLALSAFGLLPFALVMLQLRVFYALRDGRTPTLINVFMVATKVVLILIAANTMHGSHVVEALNVATSTSYLVGAVAGHVLLTRRFGPLGFGRVWVTIARIGAASLVGGVVAYGLLRSCEAAFGHGRGGSLAGLLGGALAGLAVMGLIAWRLRLPEIQQVRENIRR